MKTIKYIIHSICAIFLVVLSFSSCTEDMDLTLSDTDPRLVVDGRISTDTTTHFVRLTLSGSYFDSQEAIAVKGALVTIKDDVQTIVLNENPEYPGFYFTPDNYYGLPGRTYELNIEGVDVDNNGQDELYQAITDLNPVAPIDSVRLEYHSVWNLWKVLLYAQDPAETKDFYNFAVALNDSLISDRYSKLGFVDDRFFDGNYAAGVWVQTIDEEEEGIELKDGDWVRLSMGGITEEFYKYLEAVDEETGFKAPLFSGPPANLPGNVSNGALGFFQAYSYSIDSVEFSSDLR